jgi:hypothetical protein
MVLLTFRKCGSKERGKLYDPRSDCEAGCQDEEGKSQQGQGRFGAVRLGTIDSGQRRTRSGFFLTFRDNAGVKKEGSDDDSGSQSAGDSITAYCHLPSAGRHRAWLNDKAAKSTIRSRNPKKS